MPGDRLRRDAFVAAPMTAGGMGRPHEEIVAIIQAWSTNGRIISMPGMTAKSPPDLNAIETAACFVLVYPRKVASSALVEIGYAIACGKPSLILVHSIEDLPYFFRDVSESGFQGGSQGQVPPIRIVAFDTPEEAIEAGELFFGELGSAGG